MSPTITQRLARLADQAEHITAASQLQDARHELALARDRIEAPERLREAARAAVADARGLRADTERKIRQQAIPTSAVGLDVAEAARRQFS